MPTEYFEYLGRKCVGGIAPDHMLNIRLDSSEVIVVMLNEEFDADIFELAMLIHQRGQIIIESVSVHFPNTRFATPIPLHKDTDS